jgi:hypothetical protein
MSLSEAWCTFNIAKELKIDLEKKRMIFPLIIMFCRKDPESQSSHTTSQIIMIMIIFRHLLRATQLLLVYAAFEARTQFDWRHQIQE